MKPLQLQSVCFIGVAIAALFLSLLLPPLDLHILLLLVMVLVALLGVPHGALDPIFAMKFYQLSSPLRWTAFLTGYIFLACLVVLAWWYAPYVFLWAFLVFSLIHFSGDLRQETPILAQVLYGGASIVLPAALHQQELGHLFTLLIGDESGHSLAFTLHILAWPWLTGLALESLRIFKIDRQTVLEMGAVTAIATLLSPLIAFTIFFCFMHSARHIVRTQIYTAASIRVLVSVASGPLLGVVVLGGTAWVFFPPSEMDSRVIQFVFVGLAALTVPHMCLVERLRWARWHQN
jgi:Brp/Blh family beta-carotene 15,15'-monooxygenase